MTDAPPPNPRERIEALCDPDSFFELDAANEGVAGVGTVDGRDVAVHAGAASDKVVKVRDVALRSRIPVVAIEAAGAVGEDLPALAVGAEVLQRVVWASGVIPQLTVVGDTGSATAALSDFVFAIGGEDCPAHFTAPDEAACWRDVRRLLSYLPAHGGERPPFVASADPGDRVDPDLQALAGDDSAYDVGGLVARLLDDGAFLEAQMGIAAGVLVGFGRLAGHAVGVVANRSTPIDAAAATRAARFVRTCDAFNVPLVTLVDTPGLAPGEHGARLAYAYAEATVPKLTVVLRRAGGSAFGVMAPRQLGADLVLGWPGARIAAADVYAAAERGYVDDVIEPRETRRSLVRGLELCLRKSVERPARKHGNIPL